MITTDNYDFKSWSEQYTDIDDLNLRKLVCKEYRTIFDESMDDELFTPIECLLAKQIEKKMNIFPYPELIFKSMNTTSFDDIKVIIIGQDPYFKSHDINGKKIPEAMGLSFSVPKGIPIPSSLQNIFKNQLDFKQIVEIPTFGNLQLWAIQGCLMLNSAMTVLEGKPNSHESQWVNITDYLIQYISKNTENKVFMLWGKDAYQKYHLIDTKRHKIIVSSHPSGLSYNSPFRTYGSFKETDHFGIANNYLAKLGERRIVWQIK